jgi:hypothetical protein
VLDIRELRRLAVHNCGVAQRLNGLLQHCPFISDLEIHGSISN